MLLLVASCSQLVINTLVRFSKPLATYLIKHFIWLACFVAFFRVPKLRINREKKLSFWLSNKCSFWLCETDLNQCPSSCCLIYESISEDVFEFSGIYLVVLNPVETLIIGVCIYIYILRYISLMLIFLYVTWLNNTSVKPPLKPFFGNACKPLLPANCQTEQKSVSDN